MKHTATVSPALPRALISQRTLHYFLLGLVLLLGATLRIYQLGAESYWVDELSLLQLITAHPERIVADFRENGRPPIFVALAYGWVQLFGASEAAARSLGVLIGVAAIAMLYVVGAELFGQQVGLLSALMMALAEQQIYQAQNFRYYSLLVLLTLVFFFCYIRGLRTGRASYFVGLAVAGVLLFYTHYFAVFTFAAQGLHFLIFARRRRALWAPWAAVQAVIAVPVALQLVWPLFEATVVQGGTPPGPIWIPPAEPRQIYETLREFLLSHAPLKTAFAAGMVLLVVSGATLTLRRGPVTTRSLLRATGDDLRELYGRRSELVLTILWLLFPLLIPFFLSLVLRPMYVTRYMLGASPALYLLIAVALWSVRRTVPPLIPLGFLVLLMLPGLLRYYSDSTNEQWREVAAYVTAGAKVGDAVLLAPDGYEEAWNWYYHGTMLRCADGKRLRDPGSIMGALEQCAQANRRVWVVLRNTLSETRVNELLAAALTGTDPVPVRVLETRDFMSMRLYLTETAR